MTNKEAISIIQTYIDVKSESEAEALDLAIKALEERPQGEWINICTLPIIRKCSLCGNEIGNETGFYNNFCPNCGAKMRNITETPSSCTTTNPNSVEAYHQSLKGDADND